MARINIPVKLIKETDKAYLVELQDGRRDWVAKRNTTITLSERGHVMNIEEWSYNLKFKSEEQQSITQKFIKKDTPDKSNNITKEELLSIKSTIELLYTKLQILENKLK